jgi:hypothetical protein
LEGFERQLSKQRFGVSAEAEAIQGALLLTPASRIGETLTLVKNLE